MAASVGSRAALGAVSASRGARARRSDAARPSPGLRIAPKPLLAGGALLKQQHASRHAEEMSSRGFHCGAIRAESTGGQVAERDASIFRPVVAIENDDEFTMITVTGDDRPGILNEITNYFSSRGIKVNTANIYTEGEQVVDCFSCCLAADGQRVPEEQWEAIKMSLETLLGALPSVIPDIATISGIDGMLDEEVALLSTFLEEAVMMGENGKLIVDTCRTLREGFADLRTTEDPRTRAELLRLINGLAIEDLSQVIRFFSTYSNLLATAEEAHTDGKRRKMVRESDTNSPLWYASYHDTFTRFKDANVPASELQGLLNKMSYNPVITAHPTEARRRIVLVCLGRIFRIVENLEYPWLAAGERDDLRDQLRTQVQLLWNTDEMQSQRPRVLDEIDNGLNYFRISLIEAALQSYHLAARSADHIYGKGTLEIPSFIRFGSWIGGDRDGNPYVKPDTTRVAALLQSRMILAEYVRRLRQLQDSLTYSSQVVKIPVELSESIASDFSKLGHKVPGTKPFENEPFRMKLRIIRHRVEQTLRTVNLRLRSLEEELKDSDPDELFVDLEYNIDDLPGIPPTDGCYSSEKEMLEDLNLIQSCLGTVVGGRNKQLTEVIRLGETFGFYMMQLDIRQESTVHSAAIAEVLSSGLLGEEVDYLALSVGDRIEALCDFIMSEPPTAAALQEALAGVSESTAETVGISEAVADILEWISPEAIGAYCISMTRDASHVLEVMFLAWLVNRGMVGKKDGEVYCRLKVSPLFETIPDMENMPGSLRQLLSNPKYLEILHASGGIQEVMLGYSDSCKDGGILASAFNLYKSQLEVVNITQDAGVGCQIFHGRGGTLGRGSGPAHESILAQPPGTLDGAIKFTEQGETVTYRYANQGTAIYELTVGVTGLLKASHPKTRLMSDDNPEYIDVMDTLASEGEAAYRDLTDNTEGFYDYFYEATVVEDIGLMNIGSRPARRKSAVRDKTSLRAIPWVFAWSQSRHTLPAWFGVGTALSNFTKDNPENIMLLRKMYNDWPFFRNFLSNTEMSLYKANMEIAREYSALVEDRITQQLVYDLISNEYLRCKNQILLISGQGSLLERQEALQGSLEARNPYLDSLNMIQVILLMKRRKAVDDPESLAELEMPLLRSIKAIAAGMRNTG